MKKYRSPNGIVIKGTTILEDILENPKKTLKLQEVLLKTGLKINKEAKVDNPKIDWII